MSHKHKKIVTAVVIVLLVGGISFYGGMKYAQSKNPFAGRASGTAQGGNRFAGGARGGNATAGQVVSKDDKSITIKTRDGGSKILFYSGSTLVMKAVAGSAGDVTVGAEITAIGTQNSDGSVTAQSIQLRPAATQVSQPAK